MKIAVVDHAHCTLLRLYGRLDVGDGEPAFRDAVGRSLAAGSSKIVVDLSEVGKVDSSGAGALVQARTSCINRGGDLRLLNPSPRVEDVLTITGLVKIFQIFWDESEAIASF